MMTDVQALAQTLEDAIGPNGPYPTCAELAAHARRQVRAVPRSQGRVRVSLSSGLMSSECAHLVSPSVLQATLMESSVDTSVDLGGGVVFHIGNRGGHPIAALENDNGELGAVWYDDRAG